METYSIKACCAIDDESAGAVVTCPPSANFNHDPDSVSHTTPLISTSHHASRRRRNTVRTIYSKNTIHLSETIHSKYLANAMKAKGLQKLRWYCQVCEKQCRDENGFKCHMATESHLRQMLVVGENAGRHISDFSSNFQYEFVQLLSRR